IGEAILALVLARKEEELRTGHSCSHRRFRAEYFFEDFNSEYFESAEKQPHGSELALPASCKLELPPGGAPAVDLVEKISEMMSLIDSICLSRLQCQKEADSFAEIRNLGTREFLEKKYNEAKDQEEKESCGKIFRLYDANPLMRPILDSTYTSGAKSRIEDIYLHYAELRGEFSSLIRAVLGISLSDAGA
ncbi:MAG: hypothetical protein LBB14_02630, partial [Puniceicoccales bacterium]|nr:hypothetical protein [Puniceicoccales bacterium]